MKKKISNATKLLLEITGEMLETTVDYTEAFLFSAGSASRLGRNMHLKSEQYQSAFYGLRRHGYIRQINDDQFLITPKAINKINRIKIEQNDWSSNGWDGNWKIISFDIPESKRKQRDIFRSILKRKSFVGIQNSVFISPYADFKALDQLRRELDIEKYVSFFNAKSDITDDDTKLKEKFNL